MILNFGSKFEESHLKKIHNIRLFSGVLSLERKWMFSITTTYEGKANFLLELEYSCFVLQMWAKEIPQPKGISWKDTGIL